MAKNDITSDPAAQAAVPGDPAVPGDTAVVAMPLQAQVTIPGAFPEPVQAAPPEFTPEDAARIQADYARLVAFQRTQSPVVGGRAASSPGYPGMPGMPGRILITRAYQGFRSGEELIYPGVYFDTDPQLQGMAQWLVENSYAEYMA